MTARRTRRINSSDLPLNITPEMTSIHPGRLACWNMGPHVKRDSAWRATSRRDGSRGGGRESPAILRIIRRYHIFLEYSYGFPRPSFKEIAVNKAELTSALAM